jgi:hypothetical protein
MFGLEYRIKPSRIHSGRFFRPSGMKRENIFSIPRSNRRCLGEGKDVAVPFHPRIFSVRTIDDNWIRCRMLEICSANNVPQHFINTVLRHNDNNYGLAKIWADIINANPRATKKVDIGMLRLLSTAHDIGRMVTGANDPRVARCNVDAVYHGYIGFKIFSYYAGQFLSRGNFKLAKMCTDFSEICLYHSGFGYTASANEALNMGTMDTIIHNAQQSPFYTEMALISLADCKSMYASYPEKNMRFEGKFSIMVNNRAINIPSNCEALVFDTISNALLARIAVHDGCKFVKLAGFTEKSEIIILNSKDPLNSVYLKRKDRLHAILLLTRDNKRKRIEIDNLETIEIIKNGASSYTVDIMGYIVASRSEVHQRYDKFDPGHKPTIIDSIFDYISEETGKEFFPIVEGSSHSAEDLTLPN